MEEFMKVMKRKCIYKEDKSDTGIAFIIRDEECHNEFCDWVKSQNDEKLTNNVKEKFIAVSDVVLIRDSDRRIFTFDEDYFNELFEFVD